MNIGLWVLQGLLAAAFAAAGSLKLITPRLKLKEKGMKWVDGFSDSQVKLIGASEVLGAIGLIVPWATGILPVLTPVAAAALTFIMGGATMTHLRLKESPAPSGILGVLTLLVAAGRF